MTGEEVRYSRGRNKYDNHPQQKECANFDAFEQAVLADSALKKGLAYICAPLKEGLHYQSPSKYTGIKHWRLRNHVTPKRFLSFDIDYFLSADVFARFVSLMGSFRGFGYTTASHTAAKPRARFILALDREATRAECIAISSAIERFACKKFPSGALAFDATVYRGEQPVYTSLMFPHEVFHFGGKPIHAPPAPATAKQSVATAPQVQPTGPGLLGKFGAMQGAQNDTVGAVVARKCAQVKWAVENQNEVDEPFWYGLMGVAAFCIDPEATAEAWSNGYAGYDRTETARKLAQWKSNTTGPTTCAHFRDARPKGCADCKLKSKIVSPAQLGVERKAIEIIGAPDEIAAEVPLPKGYKRTKDGIVVVIDNTDVDVCPFDIYPLGYGKDESLGYEVVRFKWDRPHSGWEELTLRQAYIAAGNREFTTAVADQGIVLNGVAQTERFQQMLRGYMERLRERTAATALSATMGWKNDRTMFSIGTTLLRKATDGEVEQITTPMASSVSQTSSELYSTKGTLKNWSKLTSVIEKAGMDIHGFTLLAGMAAPLFSFTGLNGLTMSLFGPTGGGKSLAQVWQQSLYGPPSKLLFPAKSTQNAMFARLATHCHLPMTIDEATDMPDKEVGDFCYWVSQGRDKARLTQNAAERKTKDWATIVTVSTNKSFVGKLTSAGLDADAQMARLFEMFVPVHKLFYDGSDFGRTIHKCLNANYGHAGRAFLAELVRMGPDGVSAAIQTSYTTFAKVYNDNEFIGSERYWEQLVVLCDVAGKIAKRIGIIQFDYHKSVQCALKHMHEGRKLAADNKASASDLVHEYVNSHLDETIIIMHTATVGSSLDLTKEPRNKVSIRFDLRRESVQAQFTSGTVSLVRSHFREWLAAKGSDYMVFIQHLRAINADATPASGRASLGKNTPYKLGQQYIIGVNLSHDDFKCYLSDADQKADDLLLGNMMVVK